MIAVALALVGCTETGVRARVVPPNLNAPVCQEYPAGLGIRRDWAGPWELERAWHAEWQPAGWFGPVLLVPGVWVGLPSPHVVLSGASLTGYAPPRAFACAPPCDDWLELGTEGFLTFAITSGGQALVAHSGSGSISLTTDDRATVDCRASSFSVPVVPAPGPGGGVLLVNAESCDTETIAVPSVMPDIRWGQVIPSEGGTAYVAGFRAYDTASGAMLRTIGSPSTIAPVSWAGHTGIHTMVLGNPPMVVEAGGTFAEVRWLDTGEVVSRLDFAPMALDGEPCAGDLDGDGLPEVVVSLEAPFAADVFRAYSLDGSLLWSDPTENWTYGATCSVADLDGDDRGEVLLIDEQSFRVLDGVTGAVRFADTDVRSVTAYDHPVVADLDGDGSSEILIASTNHPDLPGTRTSGLIAYTHPLGTLNGHPPFWPGSHMHHTNVAADGSLVPDPAPWWEDPRTDGHHLMVSDTPSCPDLAPTVREICTYSAADVELWVEVENIGTLPVDGEVVVELWVDGVLVAEVPADPPAPGTSGAVRLPAVAADLGSRMEVRVRFDPDGPHAGCENPKLRASW